MGFRVSAGESHCKGGPHLLHEDRAAAETVFSSRFSEILGGEMKVGVEEGFYTRPLLMKCIGARSKDNKQWIIWCVLGDRSLVSYRQLLVALPTPTELDLK